MIIKVLVFQTTRHFGRFYCASWSETNDVTVKIDTQAQKDIFHLSDYFINTHSFHSPHLSYVFYIVRFVFFFKV